MIYLMVNGRHRKPWPGPPADRAACTLCGKPVTGKAGRIVAWHWAHESGADCDSWYEPVSEWHLGWQAAVPEDRREVAMGRHRADVVMWDGTVVEFQHSSIGVDDIRARERFYGRMVWLFDAREAYSEDRLSVRRLVDGGMQAQFGGRCVICHQSVEEGQWIRRWAGKWAHTGCIEGLSPGAVRFQWSHPRKSVAWCERPVMLDLGGGKVLWITAFAVEDGPPYGGRGLLRGEEDVKKWIGWTPPAPWEV